MGIAHLSYSDIYEFAERFKRHSGGHVEPFLLLHAVSGEVLKHYLGQGWLEDNVFERDPLDDHFRFGSDDSIDRYQYSDRIIALAEMLFHFQAIDGIDARLEDLKSSSIETGVGELEGAKLLYMSGVPFRFIEPTGQSGSDHDVLIEPSDAPAINCEMKCKVRSTELSAATVLNSLKTARSQLPRNEPGLIFVRIPESWVRQAEIAQIMRGALGRFFRGTTRVGAVVLHWEEWYRGRGALRARVGKFRVEYNPSSPFASLVRSLSLEPADGPMMDRWTYFARLLSNH